MSEEQLSVDFSEMTEEELIDFKKSLEERYKILCDERAKELASLGEGFDHYTFLGSRKIEKILKKYQDDDDGFQYLMEELLKEMKQRQISLLDLEIENEKEEVEKLSDEEYIMREIEKNKKYRQTK